MLTADDIQLILDELREKHGPGYAKGAVGKLQAKLSIMLEAKTSMESIANLGIRNDPEEPEGG